MVVFFFWTRRIEPIPLSDAWPGNISLPKRRTFQPLSENSTKPSNRRFVFLNSPELSCRSADWEFPTVPQHSLGKTYALGHAAQLDFPVEGTCCCWFYFKSHTKPHKNEFPAIVELSSGFSVSYGFIARRSRVGGALVRFRFSEHTGGSLNGFFSSLEVKNVTVEDQWPPYKSPLP